MRTWVCIRLRQQKLFLEQGPQNKRCHNDTFEQLDPSSSKTHESVRHCRPNSVPMCKVFSNAWWHRMLTSKRWQKAKALHNKVRCRIKSGLLRFDNIGCRNTTFCEDFSGRFEQQLITLQTVNGYTMPNVPSDSTWRPSLFFTIVDLGFLGVSLCVCVRLCVCRVCVLISACLHTRQQYLKCEILSDHTRSPCISR